MNYPDVIANMDRHLQNLYDYRDHSAQELEEVNRRHAVTVQKIARLEVAREGLLKYLDFVQPGVPDVPAEPVPPAEAPITNYFTPKGHA